MMFDQHYAAAPAARSTFFAVLFAALALAGPVADARAQGRVYVASGAAVVAIDTATNAAASTIPVVSVPARVVASRDGARVFTSHPALGVVSIIDAATQGVTTLTVGVSPSALAVSPDGATLYVSTTAASAGAIQVVDVASRAILATIATPASGSGGDLAVNGDGSRVFYASGAVSVIDTATRQVVQAFGSGAVQVEVAPDTSRAYVSAGVGIAAGVLEIYDLTVTPPAVVGTVAATVGDLAMTPDGSRVYAAHQGELVIIYGVGAFFPGRTVFVVDAATAGVVASIDLGASSSNWSDQHTARALAVSGDRRSVYISVPRLGGVAVADVNSNRVVAVSPVASPGSLAAAGSGPVAPYLVDAVDDTATYSNFGGVAVTNVLANDSYGGIRPTLAHVVLRQVSADPGLTLDTATGAVAVEAGAATGITSLVYEICELGASNCDQATVTVTVRATDVVDAVDDAAATVPARYALASVLANDTVGGVPATTAVVTLTQVASSAPGVALVTSSGGVFVSAGTPAGVHTLVYRICEKATPGNCDEATVTITVQALAIDAVDDTGVVTRAGGTAIATVLANDRFNGVTATTTTVTLAQVTPAIPGVTLNLATGAVAVAPATAKGTYTIGYTICEKASPANCDHATATITVTAYTITAASDSGRGSSKTANSPIASVLSNDRVGGAAATPANVVLSFVSLTPANSKIRLDLADGSVDVLGKTESRLYTLVYRICERADPENCALGTATIELSGK